MSKKSDEQSQSQKFVAAAHELGCDMTTEQFAKTLKDIATVPPMTNEQVKKKARKKK